MVPLADAPPEPLGPGIGILARHWQRTGAQLDLKRKVVGAEGVLGQDRLVRCVRDGVADQILDAELSRGKLSDELAVIGKAPDDFVLVGFCEIDRRSAC